MVNFRFKFSKDEVDERIIIDGTPPTARLYKRQPIPVEGKLTYTSLLCEKLTEAVPAHSLFRICETFKDAPKNKFRCYARCEHKINMPITFDKADLKHGSDLILNVKVKCFECLKRDSVSSSQSENFSSSSPRSESVPLTSSSIPPVSLVAPSAVVDLFQLAISNITKEISRFYIRCASSNNPEETLVENKVQIGTAIMEAWYNSMRSVNHVQSVPTDTVEIQPPEAVQLIRDANSVLNQAQLRVREKRINSLTQLSQKVQKRRKINKA